jgi:hypothetical protein
MQIFHNKNKPCKLLMSHNFQLNLVYGITTANTVDLIITMHIFTKMFKTFCFCEVFSEENTQLAKKCNTE